MAWKVRVKESVIEDLRWFGKKDGRQLLKAAEQELMSDPLTETRNVKILRSSPVAQRELRLLGKYRILYNVDDEAKGVTIVLIGEKRGDTLLVRGEEFFDHHESHSSE